MHGKIIKHKRAMDVCVLMAGNHMRFINMGYTKSWFLNESRLLDYVDFNKSDWLECENPHEVQCLRYAKWRQL